MAVEHENKITLYAPIQIEESVSQQAQEFGIVNSSATVVFIRIQAVRSTLGFTSGETQNGFRYGQ